MTKLEVPKLSLPKIESPAPKESTAPPTKPKKDTRDEIFDIQQAVFKATAEARKEKEEQTTVGPRDEMLYDLFLCSGKHCRRRHITGTFSFSGAKQAEI